MSSLSETVASVRSDVVYCPQFSPKGFCFYLSFHVWSKFKEVFNFVQKSKPQLDYIHGASLADLPEGVVFGFRDKDQDEKFAEWLGVEPYDPGTAAEAALDVEDEEPLGPDDDVELHRREVKSDRQLGIHRKGRPAKYPFNQMKLVGDTFLVKGGKLTNVKASGYQYLRLYQLSDEWRFKFFEHPEGVLVLLFTTDENKALTEIDGSDSSGD